MGGAVLGRMGGVVLGGMGGVVLVRGGGGVVDCGGLGEERGWGRGRQRGLKVGGGGKVGVPRDGGEWQGGEDKGGEDEGGEDGRYGRQPEAVGSQDGGTSDWTGPVAMGLGSSGKEWERGKELEGDACVVAMRSFDDEWWLPPVRSGAVTLSAVMKLVSCTC